MSKRFQHRFKNSTKHVRKQSLRRRPGWKDQKLHKSPVVSCRLKSIYILIKCLRRRRRRRSVVVRPDRQTVIQEKEEEEVNARVRQRDIWSKTVNRFTRWTALLVFWPSSMWPSSSFRGGPCNEPSRLSSASSFPVKGEMAKNVVRLLFNSPLLCCCAQNNNYVFNNFN